MIENSEFWKAVRKLNETFEKCIKENKKM